MIIKKSNQKFNKDKKIQPIGNLIGPVDTSENLKSEEASGPEKEDFIEEISNTSNITTEEIDIDLFNIQDIDFEQRQERRRGSRRRGYRRIDDRNLISRAQEESDNIKKSAFEEGYRIGLEQASADVEQLKTEIGNFMSAKKDVFEYIAPDILEISVEIAKKIVKKELNTDPQILIDTIIDVLKTVSKSEPKITIRVHPSSVQMVKDTIPNITYQYGIDSKINIIADPSIEDGGCIFQTNNGIVDASIDTQLDIIKKALEGM